jgi:hypothetical protein
MEVDGFMIKMNLDQVSSFLIHGTVQRLRNIPKEMDDEL